METIRQPGFYWIKQGEHDLWEVAKYLDFGDWFLIGREEFFSTPFAIHESRILDPDENKTS